MASGRYGAVLGSVHRLFGGGTLAGMGEKELLKRFVSQRDPVAFEGLVARHGPMVLGVCRRVLSDPHDVDDAFQATFLILVKKAGSLRDPDLLGPWLHGVAHRVAVRSRANAARRRSKEKPGAEETAMVAASGDFSSDRQEMRAVLDEEIARLPERFRRPVVLCYLEGLTHDEAAVRLKCPVGTVRSRMSTARTKLRDRLSRRGVTLPATLFGATLAAETASAVVPQMLIDTTVSAAIAYATTGTSAALAGTVSASAASLAEGVTNTMFVHTLKISGAVLLTAMLTVGGAGAVAWQTGGGEAQAPTAKPANEKQIELTPALQKMLQDLREDRQQLAKEAEGLKHEVVNGENKRQSLMVKADSLQSQVNQLTTLLEKERARSGELEKTLVAMSGEPPKPVQYALIGKMDMDKDGTDDRAELMKLITASGGGVVYDLPPFALGEVKGKLSPSIAFYVHDFENLPNGSEKEFQQKAIQAARNLGIQPITVEKLLVQLSPVKGGPGVENAKIDDAGDKEAVDRKKRIEELQRKIDELTNALNPINEEIQLTNQLQELEEQVKNAKAQLAPKTETDAQSRFPRGGMVGGGMGGPGGMGGGMGGPGGMGGGMLGGFAGGGMGGMGGGPGGGMRRGGAIGKGQTKKDSVVTLETQNCILVQKPDSEKISAFSVPKGEWSSYTIPKGVKITPLMMGNLITFAVKGDDVRELVAYVPATGKWFPCELNESAKDAVPTVSEYVAAFPIGRRVYAFSAVNQKWGTAELEEGAKPVPVVWPNRVTVESKDCLYVFSADTGAWSTYDDKNPAVVTPSGKIVTPPKD